MCFNRDMLQDMLQDRDMRLVALQSALERTTIERGDLVDWIQF